MRKEFGENEFGEMNLVKMKRKKANVMLLYKLEEVRS